MKFTEYRPREFGIQLHNRKARWTVLVCHRRAGKTVSACADLVIGALECELHNPQFAYLAPFRDQAKRVAWTYLKEMTKDYWIGKPNETELVISMSNSTGGVSKIFLAGADNFESLRGNYYDGVVLDEVGDIRPDAWYSVLRPSLSDRRGWAIFCGTPKGKNMFWALREEARLNPATHLLIEVKASTSGLLHADELRDAKAQMTESTYRREFECDFDASIPGAFWANEIGALYDKGQVADFPIDSELPVEVVADLGYTDSCSWWVWQTTAEGYRIIGFYEANSQPISHYIEWIKSLPYKVTDVWLPHDAKAKSLQTGRSMIETFLQSGISPRLVPEMSLQDGIEAARQVIPNCWFNEAATYDGVEHLRAYCREWDEKTQTFRAKPKHDQHSHSADSFRYMALVAKKVGKQRANTTTAAPKMSQEKGAHYAFALNDLWDTCGPQQSKRIG